MRIGVDHCFTKVSFHLVNRLLTHGYEVQGRGEVKSQHQEEMYLWIGRNANFDWITKNTDFTTDRVLSVEEMDKDREYEKYYRIQLYDSSSQPVTFFLPFLYGPWLETENWTLNDQYQIPLPKEGESWIRANGLWVEDACDWVVSSLSHFRIKNQEELILLPPSHSERESLPTNCQFLIQPSSFEEAVQKWKRFIKEY